jgi:mRNA interferase RelE/StbE
LKVAFRRSFERDLKRIKDRQVLARIGEAIREVEAAERPEEIRHLESLSGFAGCYRIRVGSYRIGVVLEGSEVEFVRCLDRRDLYRYFP